MSRYLFYFYLNIKDDILGKDIKIVTCKKVEQT